MTLGAADPVARIADIKANDARRQDVARLFQTWYDKHGSRPVRAAALHPEVNTLIDPQGRGRQFVATSVAKLAGTRIAGLVLTRCDPPGRWSADTYAVTSAQAAPRSLGAEGGRVAAEANPKALAELGNRRDQSRPYRLDPGRRATVRDSARDRVLGRTGAPYAPYPSVQLRALLDRAGRSLATAADGSFDRLPPAFRAACPVNVLSGQIRPT